MSMDIPNLATQIGDISLKQSEIKDWSVETGKQFEEVVETLLPTIGSPNLNHKFNYQKLTKTNQKIEVFPPYYVYVSNISFDSNKIELFYHFGGSKNIIDIYCYKTKINGSFKTCGDCLIWLKDVNALIRVLKMECEECVLRNRDLNISFINQKQKKKQHFTLDEIEKISEIQQRYDLQSNYKKNERKERDFHKEFNKNVQVNYKFEKQRVTEFGQYKDNKFNEPKTLLTRGGQKIYIEKFTETNNNAKRFTFTKKNNYSFEKNTRSRFLSLESQKSSHLYNNNNYSLKPLSCSLTPKNNFRLQKNNNRSLQTYQTRPIEKNRLKLLNNDFHYTNQTQQKQNILSKNLTTIEFKEDQKKSYKKLVASPVKNSEIFGKAKPSSKNEKRLKEKFEEYAKEQSQFKKTNTHRFNKSSDNFLSNQTCFDNNATDNIRKI